ncbi:MAG: cytochrome c biogenesis protein DipZ, partial [Pseudomonas sp.]
MLLIAFVGGLLTVLSPCILPVIPFVLARANQSRRDIALTLLGMAITFAGVSSLALVSSNWLA